METIYVQAVRRTTNMFTHLHGDCNGCGKDHDDWECPMLAETGRTCSDEECEEAQATRESYEYDRATIHQS